MKFSFDWPSGYMQKRSLKMVVIYMYIALGQGQPTPRVKYYIYIFIQSIEFVAEIFPQ